MNEQELKCCKIGERVWISRAKWTLLERVERGFVIAQIIDGKQEHKSLLEWHESDECQLIK